MRITRAFGRSFLDLELQKWPISAFRGAAVVVFFFDRDCVIIDRKLLGPTFEGNEILGVDDFDVFSCYRDLWKTESEKWNAVRQGIIP